jgi:iron complex transport system substrate-binding protein
MLWGNITEVVFGLGLGENVVGRDVTATFEEASQLPIVTRAHDVSAESVLSLRPTLVLASEDTGPAEALQHIRNVGIPVVQFEEPESIDDIGPRIRAIAAALGVPEAGEALVAETQAQLAEAEAHVPDDGSGPRIAFLYLRGQAGVYLLGGKGSGADSMILAAGGTDAGIAIGLNKPFTPITSESLVEAAPDVILMTTTGLESVGGIDGLVKIPGIAQTPAGRERRVVTLEDGLLYSFGPRTPVALEQLIAQLYGTTATQ